LIQAVDLATFTAQEITIQDELTIVAEISGVSFPLEPATEVTVALTDCDYDFL